MASSAVIISSFCRGARIGYSARMLRSLRETCLLLVCAAVGAGCIKRAAPPPAAVGAPATGATGGRGGSRRQPAEPRPGGGERAHRQPAARRPAGRRRDRGVQDLGRQRQVRDRVAHHGDRAAVHGRDALHDEGSVQPRVGGSAADADDRARRRRRRDPGDVLVPHRDAAGRQRRRDRVRVRARPRALREVDPVPDPGRVRLDPRAGALHGGRRVRAGRSEHDLPPRLRAADARARRREGRELREGDRDGRPPDVDDDGPAARQAAGGGQQGRAGEHGADRGRRSDVRGGYGQGDPADQPLRLRHQLAEGRGHQRDGAPHGRQPADRLQLGDQRLERGQRLQPPERRVVVHRDGLHGLRRPGRAVRRLRAREQDAGRRDAGDDPDRRLRHRRQEREGQRGREGAQPALGEVGREEAGPAQPDARCERQGRLPGRVRAPARQQAGQGGRRRHQVLLARQRARAVAQHAPAHPPGAHRATTRW